VFALFGPTEREREKESEGEREGRERGEREREWSAFRQSLLMY
jgi:hypothetical protein